MITVEVKVKATGIVGKQNKYETDSFVTDVNLSWNEAQKFYAIGRILNMGLWYDSNCKEHEDNLMRIYEVNLIS